MSPGNVGVDFRAACFCHRNVVDLGFVCSVCLSSESPFAFSPQDLEDKVLMCMSSLLLSSRRWHLPHLRDSIEAWELWPEACCSCEEEEKAEEQAERRGRHRKWRCDPGSINQHMTFMNHEMLSIQKRSRYGRY